MKTITKKLAALGVMGAGLLVVGCAQSNEGNMNTDPATGKPTAPGVVVPGTPTTSKGAMEKFKGPMSNPDQAKQYKDAQG